MHVLIGEIRHDRQGVLDTDEEVRDHARDDEYRDESVDPRATGLAPTALDVETRSGENRHRLSTFPRFHLLDHLSGVTTEERPHGPRSVDGLAVDEAKQVGAKLVRGGIAKLG